MKLDTFLNFNIAFEMPVYDSDSLKLDESLLIYFSRLFERLLFSN